MELRRNKRDNVISFDHGRVSTVKHVSKNEVTLLTVMIRE